MTSPIIQVDNAASNVPWFVRLWAAVVRRAAVDWALYKEHDNVKLKQLSVDAAAWMFGEPESNAIHEFESVCEILNLSPDLVRTKVRNLTEEDARRLRGMEFGDEW